ncbi:hypothetical protein LCGC14_0546340 [marine sediment metagenome]|uniref:HNH nuclease domain-containing protein n=1 Tax=marine sediment metagenome TaxID=412755 RepID=A0A0F9RW17_9ZZZZ|nr:TIGR02646 family protein [bacterium]
MIFIEKPHHGPLSLSIYENEYLGLIQEYGSFENIPADLLTTLKNKYRLPEVKNSLFSCSNNKCAYCEIKPEGCRLQIDHFFPKKIYPKKRLNWDNLLPSCPICNAEKKRVHDTISEPIINPTKIDPEEYFEYDNGWINPSNNCIDPELAKRTSNVLDLNRSHLLNLRLKLLNALIITKRTLSEKIEHYLEADTKTTKFIRIKRILDIRKSFQVFSNPDQKFAGFVRYFLRNDDLYQEAEGHIKRFLTEFPNYKDRLDPIIY